MLLSIRYRAAPNSLNSTILGRYVPRARSSSTKTSRSVIKVREKWTLRLHRDSATAKKTLYLYATIYATIAKLLRNASTLSERETEATEDGDFFFFFFDLFDLPGSWPVFFPRLSSHLLLISSFSCSCFISFTQFRGISRLLWNVSCFYGGGLPNSQRDHFFFFFFDPLFQTYSSFDYLSIF